MTENLVLDRAATLELAHHLDEWARWRQYHDPMTAHYDWDQFIANSREKAEWQAGLATEIVHWESLRNIQLALQDQLNGVAHGGPTRQ